MLAILPQAHVPHAHVPHEHFTTMLPSNLHGLYTLGVDAGLLPNSWSAGLVSSRWFMLQLTVGVLSTQGSAVGFWGSSSSWLVLVLLTGNGAAGGRTNVRHAPHLNPPLSSWISTVTKVARAAKHMEARKQ
jgi:hypothetical protein